MSVEETEAGLIIARHVPFIVAAYGVSAVVLIALVVIRLRKLRSAVTKKPL